MMKVDRRSFMLSALAVACACRPTVVGGSLEGAARYLWAEQGEDGGFHSTTYGLLASGQSLTPFVLETLLQVPARLVEPPRGGVDRAFEFIRRHTHSSGALGVMDATSADYPNYATALAVQSFVRAKPEGWELDIEPMVSELRRQQFSSLNGWMEDDPPYGGWGMGGPLHRPPAAGHVDLSMTRCVLEALEAAGVPASDPLFESALVYLGKSQNRDGGFFFSLVNPETNKAGGNDGEFSSYGTVTADGVLALRAAGLSETDERVARALRWLEDHHEPDRAPGFDNAPFASWATGLRFYYAGVISRAHPGLPLTLPRAGEDGEYRNSNTMVKEDDPLIATTFALQALLAGNVE